MNRGQCYVELNLICGPLTSLPVRIFHSPARALAFSVHHPELVSVWPRKDAVLAIRRQIFRRSQGECEYCGNIITWDFHMHEEVPRGLGGEISLANSRAICAGCHITRKDSEHGKTRHIFATTVVQ